MSGIFFFIQKNDYLKKLFQYLPQKNNHKRKGEFQILHNMFSIKKVSSIFFKMLRLELSKTKLKSDEEYSFNVKKED